MSKPIAIPFLLAAAVAIAFAIPAFLHPDPSRPDLAYFLACTAAACAIFGISILANVFTLPRQKMAVVQSAGTKEMRLLPRQLRSERLRNAITLLVAICLPGTFLAMDAEMLHRPYAHGLTTFLGLVAATLLGLIANRAIALRRLGDLQVTLSTAPVRLDEPFTLNVELVARTTMRVTEVCAHFLCFEHNLFHTGRYVQISVKQRDEVTVPLAGESTVAVGELISGEAEVHLDSSHYPPSGKWGMTMYPFYHWEIHVELPGDAPQHVIYPVTVERLLPAAPSLF